jgi:hypothetical protein
MVRVTVGGLVRDQRNNPVVLLKVEDGAEALPIWIGHAEALAIELHIKGQRFERPLTHDLLKTMLDGLGAIVSKVAVTDLRDNTFFAKIYIKRDSDVFVVDSRPSDSIALALKTGADIFVAKTVLEHHKRVIPTDQLPQSNPDDDLRRYLKDLDPGEF